MMNMTLPTKAGVDLAMNFISKVGFPIFVACFFMWFGVRFLDSVIKNGEGITAAVHAVEQSNRVIIGVQKDQADVLGRIDRGQDRLIELINIRIWQETPLGDKLPAPAEP